MERLSLLIALLISTLLAGGCLCFPPKNDPDPSDRIGGPTDEKPPQPKLKPAPQREPPPPLKPDPEECGAFVVEGTRMLWGLGVVNDVRDPDLAGKLADMRARKQIAVLIEYHLAAIVQEDHPDPATRPVVARELTVENVEIVDRWTIAEENAYHSVAAVPLYECGLGKELAEGIWERIGQ